MKQTTIDVATLRNWLEQGQPVTVLDIRPAVERAEWSIPESLHVDAYAALKANDPQALATLDLPSDRPIVTVCAAGKTSATAAQQLRDHGFTALSLRGGMKAWSLAWNTAEVPIPGSAACIIQVRRTGKGCLSYLVGSAGSAAVIDASLPSEVYMSLAQQRGWTITHVLETHIHADHLSRARQLAEQCYAQLYLPKQNRVSFPFTPVYDGDTILVGDVQIKALHTPGHTPESTCYLLDESVIITGDTLFPTSVGRPDLHANRDEASNKAHMLYRSLHRLRQLSPDALVLSGHTSSPIAFNRTPLSAHLGDVFQRVTLLKKSEEAFVEALLARLPTPPGNYQQIVALNETGTLLPADPTELEAGANRCAII